MMTTGRLVSGVMLGAALFASLGPAYGLKLVRGGVPIPIQNTTQTNQALPGFTVAASGKEVQDTPAGEAIRLIQAGEWIKAIQAIESLDTADTSMVVDSRGILRPLSSLKSALIASLPEAGQRAFRQLNDPAAKTRLNQALALTDMDLRARALASVVLDYPICNPSAQAADALGGIRFEEGRFDEAGTLFRFCAEHPGYEGDRSLLTAKRLIALARAEAWNEYEDLAEYAVFSDPDTQVRLGGQSISIRDLIEQLAQAKGGQPDTPAGNAQTLAMPHLNAVEFDRWLVNPEIKATLNNQLLNNKSGIPMREHTAPLVVADGDRLFTLSLGRIARLDPETGSELWHVGDQDLHLTNGNFRREVARGSYPQALIVAGDLLLAVVPDHNLLNSPNGYSQSNFFVFNANTGELRWDFGLTGESLADHNVIGQPLVVGDLIYAVTQKPGNAKLNLAVIQLRDGKVQSTLELGNVAQDPQRGRPILVSPRLAMGRDFLYVQTHSGGLIAVDRAKNAIAWAFTEPLSAMMMTGMAVPGTCTDSRLIARDGLVIAKDAVSSTVYAFREYDAAPVWSLHTDQDAAIVHVDARHVYVRGEELVALDLKTGQPVWWTRLPGTDAGRPVFSADACLVAGDLRFCRIDLTTGKLTHLRVDGAGSADLALVGDILIQSTDDSIMGYRLPTPTH